MDETRKDLGLYRAVGTQDPVTSGPTPPEKGSGPIGPVSVLKVLEDSFGLTADFAGPIDGPREEESAGPKVEGDRQKKYRIASPIGSGGMGLVHKAFDVDLNRWVAMKVVRKEAAQRKEFLTRFVEEAQVCGQLEHPNVPPIYEMGVDPNGQIYFTMKLVRGRTLREIAQHLFLGRPEVRREFTRIRVAQILQQAAMGVHYANVRGVIHRDLKPENIMVGDYGEVLVMDWGLAKVIGRKSSAHVHGEDPVETARSRSGIHTMLGVVQGTPAYMSPEQARGDIEAIDARTDVYGLGAVLYELLCYEPPHRGSSVEEILDHARGSKSTPPSQVAPPGTDIPPDLEAICLKALEPDMDARHASAFELQQDIQSYIEGSRDRERRGGQAQALVAEGRKHVLSFKEIERKRERLKTEAKNVAERIAPHAAVEEKQQLWAIEDSIAALEREASQRFSSARALFDAAIQTDPECRDARRLLADIYWERFLEAEAKRNSHDATFYRGLVEANDSGRYAQLLKGDGSIAVETDPAGAEAVLYRYVEEKRILVPREPQVLGKTPLGPIVLPMGSYLLVIKKDGYRDTRYPVSIGRSERHNARVRLYSGAEIGDDFVYVPAGEFIRGGDPESYGGFERSRTLAESFFIAKFPVTFDEYCKFLDALKAQGEDVADHIPRQSEEVYVEQLPDGTHRPTQEVGGKSDPGCGNFSEEARLPVLGVNWESGMAYARWRSQVDGREYTLPPEDAWEKAARGVDGRFHPWGDHFDWTFTKGGVSRPGRERPEPVGTFPTDESPYGVHDLAGTIREWTSTWFDERAGTRVVRGGSWALVVSRHFRCATRFGYRPLSRSSVFGFRLFSSLTLPARRSP